MCVRGRDVKMCEGGSVDRGTQSKYMCSRMGRMKICRCRRQVQAVCPCEHRCVSTGMWAREEARCTVESWPIFFFSE